MLLGAITGDVIGSHYEFLNMKAKNFQLFTDYSRFTDDTVLTVATMECLLSENRDYTYFYQKYARKYPEGIKGAQAIAAAVFLARTGKSKEDVKQYIETTFNYDLNRTCDEIRPGYYFDETCQRSVPEAIIAFIDSWDFESAIRLAVSLGGDSDTIAAMTGSIAEAFYGGVPQFITNEVIKRLPVEFVEVINRFEKVELSFI